MAIPFREKEKFVCCNCGTTLKKIEQQTLLGNNALFLDNTAEYFSCPKCGYKIKRTGLQVLPHREWYRDEDHGGPGATPNFKGTGYWGGITWEDLDGVNSIWCDGWYPKNKFRLIEYKLGIIEDLSKSQKILWPLMDSILKRGDNEHVYSGFYKINSPCVDWYRAPYMMINDRKYSMKDFISWAKWNFEVPALW